MCVVQKTMKLHPTALLPHEIVSSRNHMQLMTDPISNSNAEFGLVVRWNGVVKYSVTHVILLAPCWLRVSWDWNHLFIIAYRHLWKMTSHSCHVSLPSDRYGYVLYAPHTLWRVRWGLCWLVMSEVWWLVQHMWKCIWLTNGVVQFAYLKFATL